MLEALCLYRGLHRGEYQYHRLKEIDKTKAARALG
jgi:hypothetical protein